MKSKILAAVLITISFTIQAQVPSDGPPLSWMTIDWAPTESDGETPQTQTNSGEDWWYDVKPVYNSNGDQTGYIACGFASWKNKNDIYASGSCNPGGEPTIQDCSGDFRTANWYAGPTNAQTIGLYNLAGKMVWCKSYNVGELHRIVQSPDGNGFVAVGLIRDTKDRTQVLYNWDGTTDGFVRYNPEENVAEFTLDGLETSAPCDYFGSGEVPEKMFSVVKIDNDGDVIWNYVYGDKPTSLDQYINDYEGVAYDVVAYEDGSNVKYRCVGMVETDLNQPLDFFMLDLDIDGMMQWKHTMSSTFNSIGYSIAYYLDGSTHRFYTGGTIDDGSGYDGFIQCHEGSTSNTFKWEERIDENWDTQISSSKKSEVWALNFDHDDNLLIGSIVNMDYSTITDGNFRAEGTGKVYTITNTSNPSLVIEERDAISIGTVKTYDLKIDVTPTADNGIAVVSSKVNDELSQSDFQTDILNVSNLTPPDYTSSCGDLNNWFYWNYNASAYVAKYKLDAGEWELAWEKTIETPGARGGFPGELKKQECVYSISEAEDGGLVVCGNTSHNFDDYYLFKIEGECELENTNLLFPDVISSSDWTESAFDNKRFVLSTSGTVTINSNQKVKGLMVIPDGGKLVIDGATIEFGDGNKLGYPTGILVLRGGELEIKNGAILKASTTCDNTMWDGIQALGNPGVGTTSGVQARVAINSGCTIQDARIGVLAGGEYSNTYKWQGGGIVTTDGATFLNNRRDVIFYPYDISRNSPWFGESYLWNTDFLTTGQLRDKHNAWTVIDCHDYPSGASEHVTIWDVHGIDVVGCTFEGTDNLDPLVWSIGINSFNATYDVDCATSNSSGCTSPANSFDKLSYGINASASMPLFAPHIRGNSFEDISKTGVYLIGISYADILDNDFTQDWGPAHIDGEVPLGFSCDKCNADARAIYLYNCNRYHVEANTIDGTVPLTGSYMGVGIEIYNTSSTLTNGVKNSIYKNTFTDLNSSSFGNGENTGGIGTNNPEGLFGLDQLCGDYEGNYYDILSTIGPGMSSRQGAPGDDKSPAGNQFDGCDVSEGEIYIGNNSQHVTYVYHGVNNTSDIIIPASTCFEDGIGTGQTTLSKDDDAEWNEANSCPSEFAHTSVRAFANDLMSNAESDFSTFLTTFNNTIDNGNQQLLMDMISNNDPENTIIHTFDNDVSPYASDAVLISLMNDKPTAMSDAALVDILIDNSPVTSAVQWAFENRTPIVNATDTARFWSVQTNVTSARKLMEIKLSHLDVAVRSAKDSYIRSLIFAYDDSLRLDTIIAELNEETDTGSMAELAATYIIAGQTTNAQTTFAAFDASPNWMDQAQLLGHHSVWFSDSANVDTILNDSAFRADLMNWASDSSLVASMGSRVILEFVFEHLDDHSIGLYIIEEVSEYPTYTPAKRSISDSDDEESETIDALNFTAYPNPFNTGITFDVGTAHVSEIVIMDIRGVLIDRLTVGDEQRLIQWNSGSMAAGVYIATTQNGNTSQSIKIIKY